MATFNKFKSTTIYGNFNNSDYPDNSVQASAHFQRNLYVGSTGCTGNIYVNGLLLGMTGPQGFTGPMGLIGPTGPKGQDGITGPTGPKGQDGINGTNGSNGSNGINGTNGSAGPQGPQGPQGFQGPQGNNGVSPSLSSNVTIGNNLTVNNDCLINNYLTVERTATFNRGVYVEYVNQYVTPLEVNGSILATKYKQSLPTGTIDLYTEIKSLQNSVTSLTTRVGNLELTNIDTNDTLGLIDNSIGAINSVINLIKQGLATLGVNIN